MKKINGKTIDEFIDSITEIEMSEKGYLIFYTNEENPLELYVGQDPNMFLNYFINVLKDIDESFKKSSIYDKWKKQVYEILDHFLKEE